MSVGWELVALAGDSVAAGWGFEPLPAPPARISQGGYLSHASLVTIALMVLHFKCHFIADHNFIFKNHCVSVQLWQPEVVFCSYSSGTQSFFTHLEHGESLLSETEIIRLRIFGGFEGSLCFQLTSLKRTRTRNLLGALDTSLKNKS